MSSKQCFDNQFADYGPDTANKVLNKPSDGLSEHYLTELQSFESSKLHHLVSKMKSDIFYDGTVYTGSAGLALYYFMCSMRQNDSDCEETMKTALDYLDLNSLKGRRISFICGDAGPLALATVILYKLRDRQSQNLSDYSHYAKRLMALISLLHDSPDEILYGKSGYLYALLFVNKYTREDLIPSNHIDKVIQAILKSGKKFAKQMHCDSPLLWQWHDKIYFGAAHGMAGILYMLLKARRYINVVELRMSIKPTIDWLLKHRYGSGNFPSSLGSSSGDRLVQWCHGAPGFVPLCVTASQIFETGDYLQIAEECGDVIWQRGISTKGYSICHGVSGNAYAFLQLYQATKNPMHLYRACCFTEWCILERPGTQQHQPDRPTSLFEGIVGRLYLTQDIKNPMESAFPAFQI